MSFEQPAQPAPAWAADTRAAFERELVELLTVDGVPVEPRAGTLRVSIGGPTCVITWAQLAGGKIQQHRHPIAAGELSTILRRAAARQLDR